MGLMDPNISFEDIKMDPAQRIREIELKLVKIEVMLEMFIRDFYDTRRDLVNFIKCTEKRSQNGK